MTGKPTMTATDSRRAACAFETLNDIARHSGDKGLLIDMERFALELCETLKTSLRLMPGNDC